MMYRNTRALSERLACAREMKRLHPGFVPVVAEPARNVRGPMFKLLLDPLCTGQDLLAQLRVRIKLAPCEALFVYVDDELIPLNRHMAAVYLAHAADDEHLYVVYARESTFG